MNMEILFRGKRMDNGEWVEGLPSYDMCGKLEEIEVYKGFCDCDTVEVDPETVCQYTGLADKNGRKIFEGDILQLKDRLVRVVWFSKNAQFDCIFIRFNREFEITNFKGVQPRDYKYYEVIGNIFDNPELL